MKSILHYAAVAAAAAAICSCSSEKTDGAMSNIPQSTVETTVKNIISAVGSNADDELVRKGVSQAAALWRDEDGTPEEFAEFAQSNFAATAEARRELFDKLSKAYEACLGSYNDLNVDLTETIYLDKGEIAPIDYIFGSYNTEAHFTEDMFECKAAFITILNFPNYTLAEKNALGKDWTRLEWAYARMGDLFTERIPTSLKKKEWEAMMNSENYIAAYNIKMGHLLTEDGRKLFPEDMSLLSHWNLRDELKTCYADIPDASEKQEMIYKVMERIARQEIPECVIDNDSYDWKPFSNAVFENGAEIEAGREPDTRYRMILDVFHAFLEHDRYSPAMPTAIQRNFDGEMEMSSEEIEALFTTFLKSEQVAATAALIKKRLGRELRPYDIWYDGFKSRSAVPVDILNDKTRKLYPDAEAFHADTPRLLQNIGFSEEESKFIASHVVVEAARGSGHAWPGSSRKAPARLRTRIGADGMNYEGYNIAVHEFGHNTEYVLDMLKVDHYMLNGVPNTAFTEALAFLFQCRDLQMLGYGEQKLDADSVLDVFWGAYEIMGVSLVDMYMWRWLYEHKDADAAALREETLKIAAEVWNDYYEPVLGEKDSPILAIYSHMVNAPMYLPNYPLGDLIHFQTEQQLSSCPDRARFADEIERIYTLGRITPDEWMRQAFGCSISVEPLLSATAKALESSL